MLHILPVLHLNWQNMHTISIFQAFSDTIRCPAGASWHCKRCVDQRYRVAAAENRALKRSDLFRFKGQRRQQQDLTPPCDVGLVNEMSYPTYCLKYYVSHVDDKSGIYCTVDLISVQC